MMYTWTLEASDTIYHLSCQVELGVVSRQEVKSVWGPKLRLTIAMRSKDVQSSSHSQSVPIPDLAAI